LASKDEIIVKIFPKTFTTRISGYQCKKTMDMRISMVSYRSAKFRTGQWIDRLATPVDASLAYYSL